MHMYLCFNFYLYKISVLWFEYEMSPQALVLIIWSLVSGAILRILETLDGKA
jgi:hypothetical protein